MTLGILRRLGEQVNTKRNVNIYYDFVNMPEANGATIATITDQRGNFNGTGVNSPTCEVFSFNGDSIKSYKDETNKAFTIGSPAVTIFDQSLEVWFAISSTDGRMASGIQICGSRPVDTNRQFSIFFSATGVLTILYGYTGIRMNYPVVNALADGSLPITVFRVRLNFEGNAISVYKNGEIQALSGAVESDIALLDPTLYDNTANWHVGTINANGTLSSNTTASNFYFFLVSDKLAGPSEGLNQDILVESTLVKSVIDKYTQWQNELGVTLANIASKRADMIDYCFNGNGLPVSATPSAANNSYTGLMHGVNTSSITGEGTVRQLRWDILDGTPETWQYYIYVIPKASGSTNKWLLINRGHGSEGVTTNTTVINRALAEGYDVLWCAMPTADPDTDGQNVAAPSASAGHEALYADGIDSVTYNALELFYTTQVRAINYLFANFTVSSLYALGLSGGAGTVSVLSAMDTRIQKTIAVRGFMPRSAKYYPFIEAGHEPDFEQGGANGLQAKCGPRVYQFFTDHPQLEIMAMCADSGRMYGTITHTNDNARFGGYTWLAWKDAMKTKALELGGRYFQLVNQTSGESNHEYQPTELTRIFYEFNL